jgi:hypothetical protein
MTLYNFYTQKPVAKSSGGGGALDSILGSIAAESATVDQGKLAEAKKRRKEAEESKKSEEKAKKENYRVWVQNTLENFMCGEDAYYEFPASDNLYRLIVSDEAEVRLCMHILPCVLSDVCTHFVYFLRRISDYDTCVYTSTCRD